MFMLLVDAYRISFVTEWSDIASVDMFAGCGVSGESLEHPGARVCFLGQVMLRPVDLVILDHRVQQHPLFLASRRCQRITVTIRRSARAYHHPDSLSGGPFRTCRCAVAWPAA
jgi:hypothetical protein